jgi:hypothetical protein
LKYLYVTLTRQDDYERSFVLEGDRRQTNERMIQRALEKITDHAVTIIDDDQDDEDDTEQTKRFEIQETDDIYDITELKLLQKEEVPQYKRDNFTLVINENVTENACRVRYSGTPGKR